VTPLADGDRLHVGGRDLRVRHAPGHTAGSCVLEFDGDAGREAFVGDAVLPEYTPNVGGADVRVDRPLATYLDTLDALAARDYDRVWPGHRDPIDDPTGRIETIVDHHRERTERVVEVLREHGPADAWTVSAHLFGDLHGIHVMHGPGEAHAHLEYLAEQGLVERTAEGYRVRAEADAA
jgi:glyoxylase-like metal-dependent hydrolase (beta-lactamase superfamily II)